ncbi:MAG: penicillin-binding protein 2 [Kineosporiaceae bacterium]|nr:penicillin-binding protein 2 [Kineosporiaceae bacterium]
MNTPLRRLAAVVAVLFASLFGAATYVQFVRASWLEDRPGNARTLYKNFGRERQPIILAGRQIAVSKSANDAYKFQRSYPEGPLYSAVTGFYSIVYGATGIEAAEGPLLSGTADQLFYRRIQDLLTGKPAKGATVELTIQPKAQQAAWDALGDQRGAVVALDPRTGDVLAMVSKPAYDPNRLASHDAAAVKKAYTELTDDENRPLENRAIAGRLYPPGSTFKLVTAAAALESGNYEIDTEVDGPARLDLPQTETTLPNDFSGACSPTGKITLKDALRISCNTAFGAVGMALGGDALNEQARAFGFGEQLRIPLAVTPSQFPADPSPAQVAQSAIGQFDVRVSPLQMAMVSAAIANEGVVMKPRLVNRILAEDLTVMSRPQTEELGRAVSRDTARTLTEMMEAVVTSGTGTRAQLDGVRVAGKTGTAEHGARRPPHAWFTAFAPADDPVVAIAVVVEDGGTFGDAASGGKVAAPIAKKVMEAVISQ